MNKKEYSSDNIKGYRWVGFLLPYCFSAAKGLKVITIANILLSIIMSYVWLPYTLAHWIVNVNIY